MRHRRLRQLLALAPMLAVAVPAASASAATPLQVDSVDLLGGARALTTPVAVRRTCSDGVVAAGAPGVVSKRLTAGVAGFLDARLHGSPRSNDDWDLAVYDALTGKLVDGSAAFGSNEVVRAPVAAGELLVVQACRRTGGATPMDLTVTEQVVSGDLPPLETQRLVLIKVAGLQDVERLSAAGIDLNETGTNEGIPAVLHGAEDLRKLVATGIPFEVTVADLRAEDAKVARQDATAERRADAPALPSGRTTYRHLIDYQDDLKKLAEEHKGVVRKVVFDHLSIEGRTVEGVEIATGVERTDDGRPTVFQLGLHHVREWNSGEMTIEYALDLFKPSDAADAARKQKLLDGERTFIFPVINPDGFVATQVAGDYNAALDDQGTTTTIALIASGSGSYRRKNCSNGLANNIPSPGAVLPLCATQPGVDLNRNYGAFWGGPGESDLVADQTYRGPAPYSEPEAQNVHEFTSKHQVMVMNSNHNFAGDVLYQPGFNRQDEPGLPKGTKVPYQDAMKAVAHDAATAAGYVDLVSYDLYDVTGATEDWNYFAQGAFGYTTEVGYNNFHVDYQDAVIDQFTGSLDGPLDAAAAAKAGSTRKVSQGMREAMLRFGEAGLNPEYHSRVTGTAPAGRVLRLTKKFKTTTSKVQTGTNTATGVFDANVSEGEPILLDEHLETTLTVPASGRYEWAINPSTRPLEIIAGRTEAWTLTCEDATTHQVYDTRQVVVAIGETSTQDFTCSGAATTPGDTGATGPTGPADTGTGNGTGSGSGTGTGGSQTGGSSTDGQPGTTGTAGAQGPPGTVTTLPAAAKLRLEILRPEFSARRTTRMGGLRLFLRIANGSLRDVRATITDARKRVLLSGRIAALPKSGRVPLKRRARLVPGPVRVTVTALDANGKRVTVTRTSRLVR